MWRKASWRALWRRDFSQFAPGYTLITPKSLNSILKVESVKNKSADEVTFIWNQYHIGRGHVSAVMSTDFFKRFQERARECPNFVLPLRKPKGYISFFLQAQMPFLLLTSLEDYKLKGSNAAPYLTIAHYTDFADSKGIVLVRGDIVFPSQLSDDEGNSLLKYAHSFYIRDDRYLLVKAFTHNSEDFNFKDVMPGEYPQWGMESRLPLRRWRALASGSSSAL